jgi:hypothetical protein
MERRAVADEQGSICALWSGAAQVLHDRLSGWRWQRQHICPSRLAAADDECAFTPVQVVEL